MESSCAAVRRNDFPMRWVHMRTFDLTLLLALTVKCPAPLGGWGAVGDQECGEAAWGQAESSGRAPDRHIRGPALASTRAWQPKNTMQSHNEERGTYELRYAPPCPTSPHLAPPRPTSALHPTMPLHSPHSTLHSPLPSTPALRCAAPRCSTMRYVTK